MRRIIVNLYLLKAAERDDVRRLAHSLLRGLDFTKTYTPHFAMCTDSLSEIMQVPDILVNGVSSVMRFSSNGLYPESELKLLRKKMDAFRSEAPETVDLWREVQTEYYLKATAKATTSLRKSFKELALTPGNNFNILVLNNDSLPLLELALPSEFEGLEIGKLGSLIQIRYAVTFGIPGMINWRVLHAYRYK